MPRNSSGLYQKPAGTTAVPNTTIESAKFNALMDDLAAEMTASLARDGRTILTGDLNFNGNDLTNAGSVFSTTMVAQNYGFSGTSGLGVSYVSATKFALIAGSTPRVTITDGSTEPAVQIGGTLSLPVGAETAPSLAFASDPDTGIFSPAANQIGFSTSSVERFRLTAGAVSVQALGVLGISDGTAGAPGITFSSDPDTGIFRFGANTLSITTSSSERIRFSASDILTLVPLKIPNGTAGAPSITPFGDAATGIYAASANSISISAGSVERVRVSNGSGQAVVAISGNTTIRGVGSSSATSALYVDNSSASGLLAVRDDGYTQIPGAYANTTGISPNAVFNSDGGLLRSTSSLRYKEDVQDYAPGLAGLAKLRPVTFRTKTDGAMRFAGFIAEEVHDAGLVEFVAYDDESRPDALHYAHMVSLLTSALQEAAAQIEALTTRVKALEG